MPPADNPSRHGIGRNGRPNALDVYVGHRLAFRRAIIEMDRAELARRVGLPLAVVESMESGARRIVVSELYRLAEILEVPIGWFYEGLPQGPAPAAEAFVRTADEARAATVDEEARLLGAFRELDPEQRKRMLRYSERLRRASR
jgi:transcriptional regulator with XRE-family HTH domain